MVNVLFVCLGNICRSAAAEGVFRALVERDAAGARIGADSAATHDYHTGRPPDSRAQAAARRRGFDISGQRARPVEPADFTRFDYVLAMDGSNLADLRQICPSGEDHRLHRFLDFAPEAPVRDVPDPYQGGPREFETMMNLIELGAGGLLRHIRQHLHQDAHQHGDRR